MAKKIAKQIIKSAKDLVTSREKTRAGFVAMALEKNYLAVPYVEEAKSLKVLASKVKKPSELLSLPELRIGLLSASGLSEKSLKFLTESDETQAISGLIKEFLEPAGPDFVDELVYRFLLVKGDALGGKAKNLAGILGERKFLRTLLSVLKLSGVTYLWQDNESSAWLEVPEDDSGIEKRIKALYWKTANQDRLMIMNSKIPLVNKNVDLTILNTTIELFKEHKKSIFSDEKKYVALGELKSGFDPAGADEHWKTANSALDRIRKAFSKKVSPDIFFMGTAIESEMAKEIFKHLKKGTLSYAVNLTEDDQLTNICDWLLHL